MGGVGPVNPGDYRELVERAKVQLLRVNDFEDRSDRTLMYGYDVDRRTVHVFMLGGVIYKSVYSYDEGPVPEGKVSWNPAELVPDKRAYPESTDYEFARMMIDRGHALPFTTYSEERWGHVNGLRFFGSTAPFI